MNVIEVREAFGLENLTVAQRPDPKPGPGQVAIQMRAASLNYRDLLMVQGTYNPRQPLPLVPMSDGVGVVSAIGDGVRRVAVGDRVAPTFIQDFIARPADRDSAYLKRTLGGPLDGTLAEYMVVSEKSVAKVPAYLSDAEAATLPCAGITAWSALISQGELQPGDTVVVQGTGGVSLYALQLARAVNARVIVLSSSDEKLDRARSLGATDTINYKTTPEWSKQVKALTGGIGADHIVEVGGTGTLTQSLRAVRAGGRISVIGILAGSRGELDITPIFMRNIRLQGVFVGSRDEQEALGRAMEAARIKPVVDRVFPMAEARAAFEYLTCGKHFGKVCIEISKGE